MSSINDAGTDHHHKKKLHVAMFPWLAFGHIIPFLELAKLIAEKGHKISFISTPRNIKRLPKIPEHLTPFIDFVNLPLPHEPNLPDNAESTMDLPESKVSFLKIAHDGLEDDMRRFLESSSPDWIIHDFAPYWLPPITAKLGIFRCYFSVFSSWTVCFYGPVSPEIMAVQDQNRMRPEDFMVPPKWVPFPSKVAFRPHEAKKLFEFIKQNVSGVNDKQRLVAATLGSDMIAFRSCMELESEWLNLSAEIMCSQHVAPVGLMPPSIPESDDDDGTEWRSIAAWLDKQEQGSILYVGLGSEAKPTQHDFNELALGLELCGLPFFWVLRKQNDMVDGGAIELPEGFEERTKGRGYVWSSWAPQARILAHEAVGGYLTHCGYGSVIEGLQYGCVLVMLPFVLDQGLNARVFEDMKVGFEVPRNEEDGSFTREDVAKSIRLLMINKEGKLYRDNAKEMGLMIGNKDLHQKYIDKFVLRLQSYEHT